MMNNKNSKKVTLGILLGAVCLLSIGFAAFTASLTINTSATYTPDASDFNVVFSRISTGVDTNDVVPTKAPTTLDATNGEISGTTISNLSANFTKPGQSAVYDFYVYNASEFVAYLNSVIIGEKKCEAVENSNGEMPSSTLATAACEAITMKVKLNGKDYNATTENITDETIDKLSSVPVQVKIEYASTGVAVDGDLSVTFGDVKLFYGTTTGLEFPKPVCEVTQDIADAKFGNTVGTIGVGDVVTCAGTETFHVIPNDTVAHPEAQEGTVTMLLNRSIGETNLYYLDQTVAEKGFALTEDTRMYVGLIDYSDTLKSKKVNHLTTSLVSYDQLIMLGCDVDELNCYNAPSWLTIEIEDAAYGWATGAISYSGFFPGDPGIYYCANDGWFLAFEASNAFHIRPVVIMNATEIEI